MKAALAGVMMALAVAASLAALPEPASAQGAPVISQIVVQGVERIEEGTVRSYLQVREGDPFDIQLINRSLKSLFASGLFADVVMSQDGSALIVTVVENPVINRIAFEGNMRIKDEELQQEISLRPRVIYTRTKIQSDVNRIQTLYQRDGRFAVTVEPKIIQLPQNRVDLVFEVNEGALTAVRNIRFVGNHAFDDGDLRDVIKTRETRWYRFLTSDDTYDPDRLTFDRELLRRFYIEHGYADFQVLSALAELTPDRSNFFITFTVEEGERYRVGKVDIETDFQDVPPERLLEGAEFKEGDWYNGNEVDLAIDRMTELVGEYGYAFGDVTAKFDRDRENRTINITFQVTEGPRIFVERINITGNVRTLDEVIRREFRLVEGDAFNSAKLRRTNERLRNLDFFADLKIDRVEGTAPDKTQINVNVEEKSTGSLSVGAGYSTTNGAMAEFSVQERNLLGRGQNLSFSATLSQRQTRLNVGFTEPYFMDRELSAGFDLYNTTTNSQRSSSFSSSSTGLTLRMGYPYTEALSQGWRYTIQNSKVTNVKDEASAYIRAQEGSRLLSEVGHILTYDKRDSRLSPTQGYFARMTNDLAGLGGDAKYLRNRVSAGTYHTFAPQWMLSVTGSAGVINGIGQDVSLLDRFFLGGDSLRGFTTGGVGPRDKSTRDSLGGELMYNGSIEMTVPIGLPQELGIAGKIFTDMGSLTRISPSGSNVWDSGSIRSSAGVGVVWRSPMGPISLDFAKPIWSETYDETEAFRVNFGTQF